MNEYLSRRPYPNLYRECVCPDCGGPLRDGVCERWCAPLSHAVWYGVAVIVLAALVGVAWAVGVL